MPPDGYGTCGDLVCEFRKIEMKKAKTIDVLALKVWWAQRDSNPQPRDYESPALTVAP